MSDSSIQNLEKKIELLAERLDRLEGKPQTGLPDDRRRELENGSQSLICDIHDIAYLWGCSANTVKCRRGGTHRIKRLPGHRIRAVKGEVLKALAEYKKPAAERAAEAISKAPVRRRKSVIPKQANL